MRALPYVTTDCLAERTRAWLDAARAQTRPRPSLQLDPARCALLVVDVNRYFCDPLGACYLPASAAILPNLLALLAAWRGRGARAVFTRHGHRDAQDAGMFARFFRTWLAADDPDADLLSSLRVAPLEQVVRKTSYDAFLGTDLCEALRGAGIEQVLLTGVLTHRCVETTARAAFCRGFEVFVVADATASSTEALHLGSLTAMADAAAVVLSTEEAVAACRTSPSSS